MATIPSAEGGRYPSASKNPKQSTATKFSIHVRIEPDGRQLRLDGREGWAALELIDAGERGITAFDYPGVRVADSVFKLRRRGILIETVQESHGGQFRGQHARYIARTKLTVLTEQRAAA